MKNSGTTEMERRISPFMTLAGVSLSSDGRSASVITAPLVPKNYSSNHRAFSNTSDLSTLEAETSRPEMLSFFTRGKEAPEASSKELDKSDEEAEAERLKKEEQKRRDDEAENLRKEKEVLDKIGPPPEKPLPGDCCGNGCSPCIWDTYWDELADYKKLREEVSGGL
ncbi:hypothetical protein AXG93_4751s1110 [Marchantia polymorpha subsp. ruderalis]|uniref:Oxidoreductase-like domain-containing protein n=1 Tax=Marchantia polymorpha subsp. ruderalis TaxID=1480154 RepID=A0A176VHD2_MARPO|nr:hypothetical protein AXG93_4751s1110 [Marchantia polymorpha subsp. ruderalis]